MKLFRLLIGALLCYAALAYPNSALAEKAYKGADAGYLVYSIGSYTPMTFSFLYRKIPAEVAPKWIDRMYCGCEKINWSRAADFPKDIDYSDNGSGFVVIRKLPPGQYEIYDYAINGMTMTLATITWSSKTPLSIPFKIEPGKATYIGNFARGCWCVRNGVPSESVYDYLGYFVISDQSERDIAIARSKEPTLPEISNSVWDVSQLHHPIIFTSQPK
ncbi:hypothetical protein ABAC460_01665 [Asticcacaulis sp. AC460]|uniref:hypothetical protein n=1 Tax=Asticcacaulis sp. AC460 TaxID=1282360 RepID=UPI0003C411DD|nr:hypothetical protein [Asticcacaulis sp. AC460]ESQ92984.1 hypothetical protein ABAC460_01665 [Asticcacaulis sp. AC460]